jgi:TrmH family RNA methyltransferase
MKTITSADNALYKTLKSLDTPKGRLEQGLFLAEGPHLVEEALRSGLDLRYLVTRGDAAERYAGMLAEGERQGAETLALPEKLFHALAGTGTPQGILAVAGIARRSADGLADCGGTLGIILDRIQDPGNAGTMLRTALAVGCSFAAVTGDSADPWSQKVVRASQGAVFHLPVVECAAAGEAVEALNGCGWHTACGVLGGSDFFGRTRRARTALVIGNEAAGVEPAAAAACCSRWRLPMPGGAESLNAAVAAGIMLYDLWREQNS